MNNWNIYSLSTQNVSTLYVQHVWPLMVCFKVVQLWLVSDLDNLKGIYGWC